MKAKKFSIFCFACCLFISMLSFASEDIPYMISEDLGSYEIKGAIRKSNVASWHTIDPNRSPKFREWENFKHVVSGDSKLELQFSRLNPDSPANALRLEGPASDPHRGLEVYRDLRWYLRPSFMGKDLLAVLRSHETQVAKNDEGFYVFETPLEELSSREDLGVRLVFEELKNSVFSELSVFVNDNGSKMTLLQLEANDVEVPQLGLNLPETVSGKLRMSPFAGLSTADTRHFQVKFDWNASHISTDGRLFPTDAKDYGNVVASNDWNSNITSFQYAAPRVSNVLTWNNSKQNNQYLLVLLNVLVIVTLLGFAALSHFRSKSQRS